MQPCSVLSNGKTKASHVGPHKLGCCDLEQLIFCWVGSNDHFVPALTTWAFLFVSLSPDCLRCTRLIILFVSDRSVFASQQTCSCVGSEVSSLAFNDCSLNKCKKVCWFQSCCRAVVTLFFMSTLNESVQFKNSVSFAPQDSWVISGMWVKALPFSRSDFYHINTSLNLPLFQINSRVINVLFTVCTLVQGYQCWLTARRSWSSEPNDRLLCAKFARPCAVFLPVPCTSGLLAILKWLWVLIAVSLWQTANLVPPLLMVTAKDSITLVIWLLAVLCPASSQPTLNAAVFILLCCVVVFVACSDEVLTF